MCIIITKEAGYDLPPKDILENCVTYNSDGSGIAYALEGEVKIQKGFMDGEKFINFLEEHREFFKKLPMLIHCRITTHGGTGPGQTHPFPLTFRAKELKKVENTTDIAVAHNGIIKIDTPQEGISDSMEYIRKVLVPLKSMNSKFYKNELIKETIEKQINGSRLAFLNKEEIITVGKFIEDKKYPGCKFSNDSYEDYYKYYYAYLNNTVAKLPQKYFSPTLYHPTWDSTITLMVDDGNLFYIYLPYEDVFVPYYGDAENGESLVSIFPESDCFVPGLARKFEYDDLRWVENKNDFLCEYCW